MEERRLQFNAHVVIPKEDSSSMADLLKEVEIALSQVSNTVIVSSVQIYKTSESVM